MTEVSLPFQDGVGDGGPYSADDWDLILETVGLAAGANIGVIGNILNELAVTSTGNNNITVNTGRAQVEGTVYDSDASESKTTSSPSSGTTGRRCVLRKDWSTRQIRITIISSDDGVATLPPLTQTDGVTWEIPLASFTITTGGVIGALTDERDFTGERTVRKTADEIVNNSTTMQDDDDLKILLPANSEWDIELVLRVISATATPDLDLNFTGPSGASGGMALSGGNVAKVLGGEFITGGEFNFALQPTESAIVIRGILKVGSTSGTLQLRWAQSTATVEDTKMLQGSWLRATPVR